MKLIVNQDKCIGCGNCVALTESKVFEFDDEGFANCIVNEVPKDLEEVTNEAVKQCPTEAIEEANPVAE